MTRTVLYIIFAFAMITMARTMIATVSATADMHQNRTAAAIDAATR